MARGAQVYMKKGHADAAETVARLDDLERAMGSRPAFEAAFGVMLADRGVEFDDWEGMERSCLEPGARRCRVFYCDAQDSNQKSQAERNHEQLRRILPKERTNMDAPGDADVAECCSHVNSYPRPSLGGMAPIDLALAILPSSLFEELGVRRVEPGKVVMTPRLLSLGRRGGANA
jgi:IS30 family transposase